MWGPKRPRKKARGTSIEWKDPEITPTTTRAAATPAPYHRPRKMPCDMVLNVGDAVVARYNLAIDVQRGTYPLPALRRSGAHIDVQKGSLLVYTGEVRAVERKRVNGRNLDVSVVKHTFITPIGRCIVHDLDVNTLQAI